MYIEKIKSPAFLKGLNLEELNIVADETRQAVLNRVSKHGGHVGPNLGFVEATVALHYVFDAPKDKLVFDVSHQCYPHKVLTGRASGFLGNVDDMNAISGYSSPAECPEYDNFEVGHTSTSVMAMRQPLPTKKHGIGVCLSTLKMVAAQERMTMAPFPRPLRKKIMVRSFLTGCFAK